ncbi:histidine kinase, partial [Pseudoxanthomonas sp. SGD-10]
MKSVKKASIIFALLFCTLLIHKSFAQSPITFKGENIIIGNSVSIMEDKSTSLKIDDVQSSDNFVLSTSEAPGLPLSNSNFWLKFSIKNKSDRDHLILMIENPTINTCEIYYRENGLYQKQEVSTDQKFGNRRHRHQNVIFDLKIPIDSVQTFYIKVNSTEQMILPIIISSSKNISNYILTHDTVWGILIGILAVMVFYNLFLYLSTKDNSYLYYILYTAFTLLTQITLSGYTFKYIFYDYPLIYNKALVVFPGIAGIFGIIFIQSFLQTKSRTPQLNKAFIVSLVIYSAAVICRLAGLGTISYRLIDIAAIFTIVVIYSVAIKIAMQGYRPAK